jgi:DNA polymerase III subunit epsilon
MGAPVQTPQKSASLRWRLLAWCGMLAVGVVAAIGLGLWSGYRHLGQPQAMAAFVQAGILAGFLALGAVVWLWFTLDQRLARPLMALPGALRGRAHADVAQPIDLTDAGPLGDLLPAANDLVEALRQTRHALSDAVERETQRLSEGNARLEALLADVPVGVLMCSGDHLLAFYNAQAVDLMGAGGTAPGLGRRLFDYLREGPIHHAYSRLVASGDGDAASTLLCTTLDGARVLSARMRLRTTAQGIAQGYVLTLRDVTTDLASHARREAFVTEVFDRIRRPTATLSTMVQAGAQGDGVPARFDEVMRAEVGHLVQALADLSGRHEAERTEDWHLQMTRASDLGDGLRARMEADGLAVTITAQDIYLRCNGFEVIALVAGLAQEMAMAGLATQFDVEMVEDGAGAMIRLVWRGHPLSMARLTQWLNSPLEPGFADVSRQSVLGFHGTEIWPIAAGAGQHALCLPILHARRAVTRPEAIRRAVVYDFDLLSKERSAKVQDAALMDLTYVVFDTETTGLLPDQGDEIVQIAAVRIVNGRRVEGEVFDTLVNPRRAIPAASTAVHGITDAMVQDAPCIEDVAMRFHKFAEGAVLVAHNAPFDMAFLRRVEGAIARRFDNPILDTVLLSAVIYGQQEVHTLDALTHRLGITIPEEARHTAIGDTIATAEAVLKLLPILKGQGLATFGQVLTAVRRHGRLVKDLNASGVR